MGRGRGIPRASPPSRSSSQGSKFRDFSVDPRATGIISIIRISLIFISIVYCAYYIRSSWADLFGGRMMRRDWGRGISL